MDTAPSFSPVRRAAAKALKSLVVVLAAAVSLAHNHQRMCPDASWLARATPWMTLR